jgi:Mg2+ and Co2+ transporter CorA
MDVYSITSAGAERRPADDLKLLLEQPDALTWVDLPICRAGEAAVLSDLFGFHDLAVRDCVERNHISKMHAYDDHVFVVLHAPELGSGGHVHYIELDQFVGPSYLVTVHGPLNPVVSPDIATALGTSPEQAEVRYSPDSPVADSRWPYDYD